MEIGERLQGDVTILSPVGRINNDTSPEFQSKLLECVGSTATKTLIDLSAVDYISSAGLRALMMASKHSKVAGGRLVVANLTPMVKEIFNISRFNLVVQVFEATADALAALSQN